MSPDAASAAISKYTTTPAVTDPARCARPSRMSCGSMRRTSMYWTLIIITTIAQDKETSIIYGMPKMVKEAGLSDISLPLNRIAEEITKKMGVR